MKRGGILPVRQNDKGDWHQGFFYLDSGFNRVRSRIDCSCQWTIAPASHHCHNQPESRLVPESQGLKRDGVTISIYRGFVNLRPVRQPLLVVEIELPARWLLKRYLVTEIIQLPLAKAE